MSIYNEAKEFLISIDIKPMYINKNGVKFLSMKCQENPLKEAQSVLYHMTEGKAVSIGLFRAFLNFKYEAFGLEATVFWPDIPWEG